MAQDNKYGTITLERGSVGESEPVVVFRAQDTLLPKLLDDYYHLCNAAGSPPHHLALINETRGQIVEWQRANQDKVKVPESASYTHQPPEIE